MVAALSASLRTRLRDLTDTRELLSALPDGDPFLSACLARYLVVRSAGYLEAVRDDVADYYATVCSNAHVAKRIRRHLRTGTGVAPDQLVRFVQSFDSAWSEALEHLLDDDDQALRRSLGALVAARKKIAHGDGEAVSAGRAIRWAEAAETLGAWLVKRFDPANSAVRV